MKPSPSRPVEEKEHSKFPDKAIRKIQVADKMRAPLADKGRIKRA